jgi:L-threonylcarbamoyladenylate synthase
VQNAIILWQLRQEESPKMTNNIENTITKAVNILRGGGLVAIPTETVYGLGADAGNEGAIRKIFAAKERPYDHPLIVHLADIEQLSAWARDIPPLARRAAQAFWPGPLTLILKKQPQVLDIVTGGQDTVGLRIPRHPIAQALLQAFGAGIAAPSANKFTHISPTRAEAVREELGDRVDIILDGGDCEVGLESTIVDFTGDVPVILRPGMITAQALSQVLGLPVLSAQQEEISQSITSRQDGSLQDDKSDIAKSKLPPKESVLPVSLALQNNSLIQENVVTQENLVTRAPGMHHLHYAPTTKTVLIESKNILGYVKTLQASDLPIAVMTCVTACSEFQKIIQKNESSSHPIKMIHHLPMPQNARAYAHDLYRILRDLDHQAFKCILIEMVPADSEWDAIRDRLNKASGGHKV